MPVKKKTSQKKKVQNKGQRINATPSGKQGTKDLHKEQSGWVKWAVVAFAVIMVATMMLPSLSAIFTGTTSSSASSTVATSSDSTTASSSSATTISSVSDADAQYSPLVANLETKLDSATTDTAKLTNYLNLGNYYLKWASAASTYASTDDDKTHVSELFAKAIGYYDKYLAINDSAAVRVDRALAQYYSGDKTGATDALKSYAEQTNYGPAWAYLGMMYISQSQTDNAKNAFNRAIAADPDDTYGAKSYAQSYLSYIASSETSAATTSSSAATTSLSGVLSNALT